MAGAECEGRGGPRGAKRRPTASETACQAMKRDGGFTPFRTVKTVNYLSFTVVSNGGIVEFMPFCATLPQGEEVRAERGVSATRQASLRGVP